MENNLPVGTRVVFIFHEGRDFTPSVGDLGVVSREFSGFRYGVIWDRFPEKMGLKYRPEWIFPITSGEEGEVM